MAPIDERRPSPQNCTYRFLLISRNAMYGVREHRLKKATAKCPTQLDTGARHPAT